MRRVLVFALIISTAACWTPRQPNQVGIVGTYVVNGTDPSGIEYSGSMTIREADGGTYPVSWIITGAVQEGSGTRSGDTFEVTWTGVDGGGSDFSGTATYTIAADGSMQGVRRIDGIDREGIEEVFPGN
jgi:hypothetical protein